MNITHFPNCISNYPEKVIGEAPQEIVTEVLSNGYTVWTCVDCGAIATDLPPDDDPYWDDVW